MIPILEAGARTGASTDDPRAGIGVGFDGDPMYTLQGGKQHAVGVASTGDISHCLNAGGMGRIDYETETLVTHALTGEGFDASEDGTGRGTPLVPVDMVRRVGTFRCQDCECEFDAMGDFSPSPRADIDGWILLAGQCSHCGGNDDGTVTYDVESGGPVAYRTSGNCGAWETGDKTHALTTGTDPNFTVLAFFCKDHGADAGEISPTLRVMEFDGSHANGGGQVAVALNLRGRDGGSQMEESDVASIRAASGGSSRSYIGTPMAVRRLTPLECERLQGFPDSYTAVTHNGKPAADGPRYKALGNSMAVPVVRWIGERLRSVASE